MILIDDRLLPLPDILARYDDVRCYRGGTLTNRDVRESGAQAIICRSTTIVNAALLDGTDVRFVGTATSGTDHIDREECERRGIVIADAGGCNANAVVEWVAQVLLRFAPPLTHPGPVLGIVGMGHVGSRLRVVAERMGYRVLVNDPPLREGGVVMAGHVDLGELLATSDVVTLHVPHTQGGRFATHRMIDAGRIDTMRRGALLVNAARGGIVDQTAVLAAVVRGDIRLAIDVMEGEPHADASYVAAALLATPHVAGHTRRAFVEGARMVASAWCAWKGIDDTVVRQRCAAMADAPRDTVEPVSTLLERLAAARPLVDDDRTFRAALAALGSPAGFTGVRSAYPLRDEMLG